MIGVLRPIDDKLAWIHVFKQYFSNLRHGVRERHLMMRFQLSKFFSG